MVKVNIIKVGGKIVEDSLPAFLDTFVKVQGPKVLVHGGGRTATAMAAKLGIETKMVGGRRITDKPMLDVVTMVYGGLVNKNIVASLQERGVNAIGLTGADMNLMLSDKRPVGEVDYGYVGDVRKVNAAALASFIEGGAVPVLAPLTHDGKGHILNTNADTIAAEAAKALASMFQVTLTYCFEMPGVLSDPENPESVIPEITPESFKALVADGTVSGGMIPKLENAIAALRAGVDRVVITSPGNPEGGTVITL
jgi:acetylglutamate kinase